MMQRRPDASPAAAQPPPWMPAMYALLHPAAIAVVGASQRASRGSSVIANLKQSGFAGDIFAVNPRYDEVLGCPCVPDVGALPPHVDCILVAVGADAACDVLEQAFAHGVRAAIVVSSGFGEGGQGGERAVRLQALADRGMCICGPNCFGIVSVAAKLAAFSGVVPRTLRPGPVALVSQSGSLGNFVFSPLMRDRGLGFRYFVSCGNQIGARIEDYVAFFADDPEVTTIGVIAEALKSPAVLASASRRALEAGKSIVVYHAGKTALGAAMTQSHTGAVASDTKLFSAFLRRCGIVEADTYEDFVETLELFGVATLPDAPSDGVAVVSGSGGGAMVAADHLSDAGVSLVALALQTQERMRLALPAFATVANPTDATGAMYDDPEILPKLFEALRDDPAKPVIVANVIVPPAPVDRMRRIGRAVAEAARASGRTVVAYQSSALGALDAEIVDTLRDAGVPLLLGIAPAAKALRNLFARDVLRCQALARSHDGGAGMSAASLPLANFMAMSDALTAAGVPIVETVAAFSEREAVAAFVRIAAPVVVKADAAGLVHKSDLDGVRLNCAGEAAVAAAYREVVANAAAGGFPDAHALVQPMAVGVAEMFAGVINDPLYGPGIVCGLGGVFVEILDDVAIEMAPLTQDDALAMIGRLKGAKILDGARGRPKGDVSAFAALLVALGGFAMAHRDAFRSLDLNPVIVGRSGQGVVAVDIAVEA